jgi:hypothetical protein
VAKDMKERSALYIYVKNDLKSMRKMLWRIIFANKLLMMMIDDDEDISVV